MTTSEKLPVYRRVDGKLVRIPGDKRDPKRRYAHVSNVKENRAYLREYTDEEERQRDEEEAKWRAEQPQRDAERRQQEEEFERFKSSLKYELRIAAYLDVLGWGEAIDRSVSDPDLAQKLGIALNSVQGHVSMITWMCHHIEDRKWPGDPQVTHFSDCVLLSVSADNQGVDALFFHLRSFVSSMLRLGFLVRGGIALGPLIHRGSMVYGPALVRAYHLERDHARWPRIIIDPPLPQLWGVGPRVQHRDGTLIGYQKRWREDNDGWWYFDFLQPFLNMPDVELRADQIDSELKPARALIDSSLRKFSNNPPVAKKYVWLSNYFNCILEEHRNSTLTPISIDR